ncbi:MAG TPA: glycoside hydrolase family 6 protein [Polyangiales bacterium]
MAQRVPAAGAGGAVGAAGSQARAAADAAAGGGGAPDPDAGSVPAAAAPRVDNPYAGATGYVNPEWRAHAMAEPGGERIATTPTAVWIDRIAAIEGAANGAMGVRAHLDAALQQGAGYIQFVIYDLPGRDCAALASNGELGKRDLPRYEHEYIDPIVAVMAAPKYRTLHIIDIVEVDSLPNLVTNTNIQACADMKSNGAYVDGIAYALAHLGALPNTYNYVDAAHHGWLGWDSNFRGPPFWLLRPVQQRTCH